MPMPLSPVNFFPVSLFDKYVVAIVTIVAIIDVMSSFFCIVCCILYVVFTTIDYHHANHFNFLIVFMVHGSWFMVHAFILILGKYCITVNTSLNEIRFI